jgi:hypothetical protein
VAQGPKCRADRPTCAAPRVLSDHGGMSAPRLVVVSRPSPSGVRRFQVSSEILGLAHNLTYVVEFLRRAGLEIDAAEVATSPLIN